MPLNCLFKTSLLGFVALVVCGQTFADVIETKGGARLVGTITLIDNGFISMKTDYAGEIKIKQTEVTAIETEKPFGVRMVDGSHANGRIITGPGGIEVAAAAEKMGVTVKKIAASWPEGSKDPAVLALERHWSYEATLDINGESGNHSQLGSSAGISAKLANSLDTLLLAGSYNRQVTDGAKSADQLKMGADYSATISERASWFARDTGGYDRIMDVRFQDTAAGGVGYSFVKNAFDQLTGRVGLAYVYQDYINPLTPTESSLAGDFEIAHDMKFPNWELVNNLKAEPALNDLSEIIVSQDSFYQVPLTKPNWKLRVGFSNDYNSKPGVGIKRLDTMYYTRLILDWK